MSARLVAVGLVTALLLPQPSPAAPARPAADRAGASVEVAHLMFMPGKVRVRLGDSVTWTFPEATSHTTTSDQGFWDSGVRSSGQTYARTFTSAGRFPYHCSFHPTMRGSVSVDLEVDVPGEGKRIVRWSTVKGAGGVTFDVQLKVGSGPWTDFRSDTVRPKAAVKAGTLPDETIKVRARTSRSGQHSGWSKAANITFA